MRIILKNVLFYLFICYYKIIFIFNKTWIKLNSGFEQKLVPHSMSSLLKFSY